eukprot:1938156-Rhodomonas_salina.1
MLVPTGIIGADPTVIVRVSGQWQPLRSTTASGAVVTTSIIVTSARFPASPPRPCSPLSAPISPAESATLRKLGSRDAGEEGRGRWEEGRKVWGVGGRSTDGECVRDKTGNGWHREKAL